MKAVFDKDANLVAWFDDKNLFDINLSWVAFVVGGNVFSANRSTWLGPYDKGSFQDRTGKPVAWVQGTNPHGGMRPMTPMHPMRPMTPMRPMRPMTPMRPMRPMVPLGGWSTLTFAEWLAQ
ncbi:hypothetical protein J2S30_001982 [Herbaspirillum rubrisubalbicans]|uniref:4-fold beta flower protein n=1 Tax=Herbaspirillum rubrisubalbicans TaxID=80842 RepID=UPI00344C264D|nr:hypothetical protein [Herbaspirillum rubrisubalbicans]